MVEKDGPGRIRLQPRIESVIRLESQVKLAPVEVTALNGDFFSHLAPVSTGLESCYDMVWEVATPASERIVFEGSRRRLRCHSRGVICGLEGLG